MTRPTSVRDALQQARQHFPRTQVLFATDGVKVIGDAAWDDPCALPLTHADDRPQWRESHDLRQGALMVMREAVCSAQ